MHTKGLNIATPAFVLTTASNAKQSTKRMAGTAGTAGSGDGGGDGAAAAAAAATAGVILTRSRPESRARTRYTFGNTVELYERTTRGLKGGIYLF